MLRYTDMVKLINLLEMFGKEEELEQGSLSSEVNGCVHEGPMDEDTTHVRPFYQLRVWHGEISRSCSWHCHLTQNEVQRPALQTVVDISHIFNELLLRSVTRE